jgi:AraC-like DNA-binding protein
MTALSQIGPLNDATASSALAWPAVGRVMARGLPAASVTRPAGLRLGQLADSRLRIPVRALHMLWNQSAELLGEHHIGLQTLSVLNNTNSWPEPFSLYESLFRASNTMRDGVERLAKYARILRDGFGAHIEDRGDLSLICFELAEHEPWPLVELHVGMGMVLQRRVLPGHSGVREVWFRRPPPQDRQLFDQVFGVRLRFNAPENGLLVDTASLLEPLPDANPSFLAALEWRANAQLEDLPDLENVIERVRRAVVDSIADGDIRVERVAKKLALSPRTLHRRLQAEGESFQSVLDATRCDLAKRDLASGRYSVSEVSRRVGFTSVSAFSRAFKLWTDRTPLAFQQQSISLIGSAASNELISSVLDARAEHN